jgi:hypothetical protein
MAQSSDPPTNTLQMTAMMPNLRSQPAGEKSKLSLFIFPPSLHPRLNLVATQYPPLFVVKEDRTVHNIQCGYQFMVHLFDLLVRIFKLFGGGVLVLGIMEHSALQPRPARIARTQFEL